MPLCNNYELGNNGFFKFVTTCAISHNNNHKYLENELQQ